MMKIMLRPAAKAKGLHTYFTGKPCKNGHVAYRYVQSGGCSDCIKKLNSDESLSDAAVMNLVEMRVRAHVSDVNKIRECARGLCLMRYPDLTTRDVAVPMNGTHATSGTAMYRVKVPLDDIATLQSVANALINSHKADIESVRSHVLRTTLQEAEKGTDLPGWTERP